MTHSTVGRRSSFDFFLSSSLAALSDPLSISFRASSRDLSGWPSWVTGFMAPDFGGANFFGLYNSHQKSSPPTRKTALITITRPHAPTVTGFLERGRKLMALAHSWKGRIK